MAAPLELDEELPPAADLLSKYDGVPRDEIILDGICLADLGPTEVDDHGEENLTVFYALQLTPVDPGPAEDD